MNVPTSLALALMLGGAAMAQGVAPPPDRAEGRSQDRPEIPAQETVRRATGIVVTVDAASGKLQLKDDAGKVRRYHAKTAKVLAAQGKVLSLADLAIGDTVSLTYGMTVRGRDVTEIQRVHKALKR